MKLMLMADGDVGFRVLEHLLAQYPGDLDVVVTTSANEIHDLAVSHGLRTTIYESESQLINFLGDFPPDLGLLAWWPKILREKLLTFPRQGFVNTHPSLLPYNRGKHYNFWALVEQVPFGVTLHRVDIGIDTGEIVAQKSIDYDWTDTGETLYFKAQAAMFDLVAETYPALRNGTITPRPQGEGQGSYHHSSEIEAASHIDLNTTYLARDLLNLLRARTFQGYPGCWFVDGEGKYEVTVRIRKL